MAQIGFKSAAIVSATLTMLALSGCTETLTMSGRVLAEGVEGAWICLDRNPDLRCDDSEPGALVQADGSYAFERLAITDVSDMNLVVQIPEGATTGAGAGSTATGAFILAAPAVDQEGLVTGLSTLLALHRPVEIGGDLLAVEATVKQALRLPAGVSLQADPNTSTHPGLQALNDVAVTAMRAGAQAHLQTVAEEDAQAGPATQAAAQALLPILGRYTQTSTGQLLHTVSARTLVRETVAAFTPNTCVTQAPPVIVIDTENSAPILDKENYLNARLTMNATPAFPKALDLTTRIRGRGNSTWAMDKKPYRLKLDSKAKMLGMTSDKDWAMLANYTDKTMLRNATAMCLGKVLALDFTPTSHFAELQLNNAYQGLYQIIEHIKVAEHRANIGEEANDPNDRTAGFLLEIDVRLDEDHWFYSQKRRPYTVKSDIVDPIQVQHIEAVVNDMESSLFGPNYKDPVTGYAAHLDMEALVDFYLINEYLRNNDAFYSSTFVTRERGGKLKFGPLWDFDLAAGNVRFNGNDSPIGWYLRNPATSTSVYINQLFTDPVFAQHVEARWHYLKQQLPALQQFIRQSADTLQESQTRNFQRWNVLNTPISPSPLALGSYEAEVQHLQSWLEQRAQWMDEQLTPAAAIQLH